MVKTIQPRAAQALVRYRRTQISEDSLSFISGVWTIFGHGNAAWDGLPIWRGHSEQTMALAAIAYAKQLPRRRATAAMAGVSLATQEVLRHVRLSKPPARPRRLPRGHHPLRRAFWF